jgi:hypothetical protein
VLFPDTTIDEPMSLDIRKADSDDAAIHYFAVFAYNVLSNRTPAMFPPSPTILYNSTVSWCN